MPDVDWAQEALRLLAATWDSDAQLIYLRLRIDEPIPTGEWKQWADKHHQLRQASAHLLKRAKEAGLLTYTDGRTEEWSND